MKTSQKGMVGIALIIILAVALGAGGTYYVTSKQKIDTQIYAPINNPTPTPSTQNTNTIEENEKPALAIKAPSVSVAVTPTTVTAKTEVKNPIPGKFNGSKYSFSYPEDWVAFEDNDFLGSTVLYPESKSIEAVRKTLPTTSKISISITPVMAEDLVEARTVVIDGITWYVKNYGKTDGGNEDGIAYMRKFNNDTYVVLFTGVSNKATLEMVASSFLAG